MPLAEQRDPTTAAPQPGSGGRPHRRSRPSALNPPNIITLSRLLLAVFLFWLIDISGHWLAACVRVRRSPPRPTRSMAYIARRYGMVTKIGRILDPFVDKVIIGGAFMFLAVHARFGGQRLDGDDRDRPRNVRHQPAQRARAAKGRIFRRS